MAQTQRITMAGRTYTFVPECEPEMDGHDNATIGHLLNSRGAFAGYVVEMTSGPRTGRRLLMGGPSGISRDAEREGLAQIVTETSERTRDQVRADWARIARQAVSYSDGLTTTERSTLHEAAEVLKGRPDILAQWIEAAQAEGAILGPSASVARPTPHRHSASCHGAIGELLCEGAAPLSARR